MNILNLLAVLDVMGFQVMRILLSSLWQSSILLGAIGILSYVLRHKKESIRYCLLVTAIILIPLLPLLSWGFSKLGTPRAEISVIPVYSVPNERVGQFPMNRMDRIDQTQQQQGMSLQTETQIDISREAQNRNLNQTVAPAPVTEPDKGIHRLSLPDYPWAFAMLGYTACAMFFILWVIVGRLLIRNWIVNSEPVIDSRVIDIFHDVKERMGLSRDIIVIENKNAPAPMTCRTLHPAVILPAGYGRKLSDDELQAVAVHELSHVKRNDMLILTLVSLVRAVFFFHPLIWLAAREVSFLVESSCDSDVLEVTGEPVFYADMLTRIARDLPNRVLTTELAVGIVFSKSMFFRRIRAILSEHRDRIRKFSRLALMGTVVAAVISLVAAIMLPLGEARERGEMVTVSGKVVYEGTPVKGARIYLNDLSLKETERVDKTDKNGRYSFEFDVKKLDVDRMKHPAVIAFSSKYSMGWQQLFCTSSLDNITISLGEPLTITGQVVDISGNPIKGADVTISNCFYVNYVLNRIKNKESELKQLTTRTNRDGRFSLTNLPYGISGSIIVKKEGYAYTRYYNIKEVAGSSILITMESGNYVKGKITYAETNTPAKRMKIKAFPERSGIPIETTTDDYGNYTLSNVPEGNIYIYVLSNDETAGFHSTENIFYVPKGEIITDCNISLVQEGIITGQVIDKDTGNPISNHRVGYHTVSISSPEDYLCETMTDEKGMFRFKAAPGVAYIMTTAPNGYEKEGYIQRKLLVEPSGEHLVETFSFNKSTVLHGKVVNKDNHQVANAEIFITYQDPYGSHMVNTFSDENGSFTLTGFKTGQELVLRAFQSYMLLKGIQNIECTPDADITITCESYETTGISGKVVDQSGNPVSGTVVVLSKQTPNNMGFAGIYTGADLTDKDGVYKFNGLIIGDVYNVKPYKSGYATSSNVDLPTSFTANKQMDYLDDLLIMKTDRILKGAVIDSEGESVSGALVYEASDGMSGMPRTNTDMNGQFVLEGLAEIVIKTLIINHRDYGSYRFFDIPTNETHYFTLTKPLGSFSGQIIDAENKTVEKAYIYVDTNVKNRSNHIVHDSGLEMQPAKTDKDGQFIIKHVLDKKLSFSVWLKDLGMKKFEDVDVLSSDDKVFVFDKADESKPSEFVFNPSDLSLLENNPVPEMIIEQWLYGDPIKLADLYGNVIFLDFWDHDEKTITNSIRKIEAYKKAFSDQGIAFIAIHEHIDNVSALKSILKSHNTSFSVALDRKSLVQGSSGVTFDSYGIKDKYRTVLIDRKGLVHLDIPTYKFELKLREYLKGEDI